MWTFFLQFCILTLSVVQRLRHHEEAKLTGCITVANGNANRWPLSNLRAGPFTVSLVYPENYRRISSGSFIDKLDVRHPISAANER